MPFLGLGRGALQTFLALIYFALFLYSINIFCLLIEIHLQVSSVPNVT